MLVSELVDVVSSSVSHSQKLIHQPRAHMSNFQNLRHRRYYISGHQVSRSVSKSSGTIGSTRKNDTYIVVMYTGEMHKHDVAYCHTLQTLIF